MSHFNASLRQKKTRSAIGDRRWRTLLLCSAGAALVFSGTATAQDTSNSDVGDSADSSRTLNTITVTAQKRDENLQDVPISITTVSSETIQDNDIGRLDELSTFVPNLQINQDTISDRISIRGIGSGAQAGFEQSVGTFVDGIYRGRGVQSRFAFLDLASIEVLRGPQGTLFGKNTVAGALNITSARPTDDFSGYGNVSYDTDKESVSVNGALSGPLSDTVRGRVAFQTRNQDKGWVVNPVVGEDGPRIDEWAGRLSLDWDATPNTLVSLKYEHGDFDVKGGNYEHNVAGPLAALGVEENLDYSINTGSLDLVTGLIDPVQDIGTFQSFEGDTDEFSLSVVHEFANGGELTAIGSYSQYEFQRAIDADLSPAALIRFDDSEDFDQTTLELRYASNNDGPFNYLAGAYYLDGGLVADGLTYANINTFFGLLSAGCAAGDPTMDAGTAFACGSSTAIAPLIGTLTGIQRTAILDQSTEAYAVFGQGTYDLTDTVRVTAGLRFTNETKEGSQVVYAGNYAVGDLSVSTNPLATAVAEQLLEFTTHDFPDLSRDEESLTWSLNAQWDATDDVMLYASAATGFKAGGFNSFYTGAASGMGAFEDEVGFDEENALSFELGAKSVLADGSAELNVAVFNTTYEDLQAAVFSGNTTFNVENAAEATTQGIEIDGRWRATENLTFTGGAAWTDFEFDSFPNQACTNDQFLAFRQAQFAAATSPAEAGAAAALTAADCSTAGVNDIAGRTAVDTPELSFNIAADYEQPFGSFLARLGFDYSYQSSAFRQADLDPILESGDFGVLNARVSFGPESGNWNVNLLVKNLTDEYEINGGNDVPLSFGSHFGSVIPPQTIVVGLGARF